MILMISFSENSLAISDSLNHWWFIHTDNDSLNSLNEIVIRESLKVSEISQIQVERVD